MSQIFEGKEEILPYAYPHLIQYAKAIQHAFWVPEHFNYEEDIRSFKLDLDDTQRSIVERSMLAIGVVENKVKSFWAYLPQRMDFTEISDVCFTFAGNEVVHRQTYATLLERLNLQDAFDKIFEVPCMKGRGAYLTKYLKGAKSRSDKEYTKSLILFTLLIENGSLMSQFLTLSSFKKFDNKLNNFSTIINATAREEIIHGKFGSELINIIKAENPTWFDDEMEDKTRRAVRKAMKAESEVLDWIFEKGELPWISKVEINEFLKTRFNDSLNQIGYSNEFEVDEKLLEKSQYFETMLLSTADFDFFDRSSSDYNVSQSFSEDALWD